MGQTDLHFFVKNPAQLGVLHPENACTKKDGHVLIESGVMTSFEGTSDGYYWFRSIKAEAIDFFAPRLIDMRPIKDLVMGVDLMKTPPKIMSLHEVRGRIDERLVLVELKKLDEDLQEMLVAIINRYGLEADEDTCPLAQEAVAIAYRRRMGFDRPDFSAGADLEF